MDAKDKEIEDLKEQLNKPKMAWYQAETDLVNLQKRMAAMVERHKRMCESRVEAAENKVLQLEKKMKENQ